MRYLILCLVLFAAGCADGNPGDGMCYLVDAYTNLVNADLEAAYATAVPDPCRPESAVSTEAYVSIQKADDGDPAAALAVLDMCEHESGCDSPCASRTRIMYNSGRDIGAEALDYEDDGVWDEVTIFDPMTGRVLTVLFDTDADGVFDSGRLAVCLL